MECVPIELKNFHFKKKKKVSVSLMDTVLHVTEGLLKETKKITLTSNRKIKTETVTWMFFVSFKGKANCFSSSDGFLIKKNYNIDCIHL